MTDKKYCYQYPHPAVTADCVIFGYDGEQLRVLLIERGAEPYKGCWALPGGFMNIEESAEECARRELEEETGLTGIEVVQFHTASAVERDPRERVITVAHYALVPMSEAFAGDDARNVGWFALDKVPTLAFDHAEILPLAIEHLRHRICTTPLLLSLMPEEFTVAQLATAAEAVLGTKVGRQTVRRKLLRSTAIRPISRTHFRKI